ncbi:MAG: NAD(+) synthase [Pseudomonadales bacterium]|nr:NAD(+) synthase [Pseudomonadales bacterium]
MKVCLAQINTTPGDFKGNSARVRRGIDLASTEACDLIVFPELTIPGYLSQDLLYNPEFIDRNLEVLEEIVAASRSASPGLHIVVGYIDRNRGVGKPFTNMAAGINGGKLIQTYQKQLLPFYDVFDELRYFEAGSETTVFLIRDWRVGVAICEDLWNDKGADDYNYDNNPLEQYRNINVDVLLSINSSPFVRDKCSVRLEKIAPASADGMAIVYVNQIGGQDELVFDGGSFVVQDGELTHFSDGLFDDSYEIVDLADQRKAAAPAILTSIERLTELLILGLRDYVQKSGFSELVLASSGGVDSAAVCKLACSAVGPEKVHAIRMPSVFSSQHSRDDARALHENLGCWDYEVPVDHEALVAELNQFYSAHESGANLVRRRFDEDSYLSVADENIQARLRDVYLMHFSNAYGAMPLSTGNKTEAGCGYYTHFDMNFSYAPIKDLYKFQVIDIAMSDPNIPGHVWQKPPSAELSHGQTDEASLLPYAILDPIVMSYVEDYVTSFDRFREWVSNRDRVKISGDLDVLTAWLATEEALLDYRRILSLIGKMEYKRRQTCPGTKVSKVAFGTGRRIPIVERWS